MDSCIGISKAMVNSLFPNFCPEKVQQFKLTPKSEGNLFFTLVKLMLPFVKNLIYINLTVKN